MTTYARTVAGRGQDAWQPLEDHLSSVANLAAALAGKFDSSDAARIAGAWHDIGKYAPAFQRLLTASADGESVEAVDHSTAGAILAAKLLRGEVGAWIAFVIAGHHAGLSNHLHLRDRLQQREGLLSAVRAAGGERVPGSAATPSVPEWLTDPSVGAAFLGSRLCGARHAFSVH